MKTYLIATSALYGFSFLLMLAKSWRVRQTAGSPKVWVTYLLGALFQAAMMLWGVLLLSAR